jgi:STE24 endopeptidase
MPLLSILIVLLAVQAVPWPAPLFGGGWIAVVFNTVAITAFPICAAALLSQRVQRMLIAEPNERAKASRYYLRGQLVIFALTFASFGLILGVAGWGRLVWVGPWRMIGPDDTPIIAPFAELLVALPYILMTVGNWLAYYSAERALILASPVVRTEPFFSRPAFIWFRFRFFALFVFLPAILASGQQSFTRFFPGYTDHPLVVTSGFFAVIALLVFLPFVVPRAFGWVSLQPGPLRDRLEALARRCEFRYRRLYLWPTRNTVANALVLGLISPIRYVVFTDKLIELLDEVELDSVLGHEIGHAKHGHIPYYALFLILSGTAITAAITAGVIGLRYFGITLSEEADVWLVPISILLLGAYLFVVFGYLSRRCERQSDIFGCRAASCGQAHCFGHTPETVFTEKVGALCPTGIRTFVTALERVVGSEADSARGLARLWALIRSWQHGPPGDRINYLINLIERPEEEARFQRRFFVFRIGLVVGLSLISASLVVALGWRQVLSGM